MSRDDKDEEMIYGLTMDERDALQRELSALPDTMPPRAVWHSIREQAEAEGLMQAPRSRRPSTWYVPGGIAAMFLMAALIVPQLQDVPVETDGGYTTPAPDSALQAGNLPLTRLQTLMVESRQLEEDLRSLPDEPKVVRAGTRATILELEDRIAAIDFQLSDPESQLTPDEVEIFWAERVRLMKTLVGLRYAQAQRTAF